MLSPATCFDSVLSLVSYQTEGAAKIIFSNNLHISLAQGAGPGEGHIHCCHGGTATQGRGADDNPYSLNKRFKRFHQSSEEFFVINNNVIKSCPQDGLIRPQFSTKARLLLRIQFKQSRLSFPISPPRPVMARERCQDDARCAVRAPLLPINHHKHLKVKLNHRLKSRANTVLWADYGGVKDYVKFHR